MPTHIALLRGINVGGHRKVGMADLRNLLVTLEFSEPRSLLQSGNLVFRCDDRKCNELEKLLEKECHARLHLNTEFFVRTASEWSSLIAANPFPDEAKRDPGHLVVMFLKDSPSAKRITALQAAISGPELVRAEGRHAYIVYPVGIGRSRLTGVLIDKMLGTRGTGRNWNTVLKLAALAKE